MELENVYNGSFKFYKVFSSKMKKESPERCEPPKNNKRSSHGKLYKKNIEKGGNEKRKLWEKFVKVITKIKLFTFNFVYGKGYTLLENINLGKCSLYYYISSKALFSTARYLKRKWNTIFHIDGSCTGLVEVVLSPWQ